MRLVLTRADPPSSGARVTREFREGDSEVTIPGAPSNVSKQADGLYVDVNEPPRRPKTDNMSKEMKARLRAEYTGLGGAENKAMSSNYFLWISIIVALLAISSKLIGAI
ncbi:hypothetical protein VOLCADRAFT_74218 [Volvox carteri f. nagariensis]|uniref:Uncharacterized protein n=1 Tax=Volvox carteri f. nagariensis TaxID=3068 RepID=D8TSR2_VOLCA|nr:uncharacterized protein VOLCADRAFT_74218 [Volvox carteri f. nagariensis]EFJ49415.1 hypothetical protein VOLCADRAFT_74218 [Volvox carteri f. nagariensis]|eukprot:XP_002949396.1 hypothetical protein VOLCADRAFT_74218 [Volvox carteri f. nagariensis]